jgi:hypothetical protein
VCCRPHHETLKAYVRKLSALALEVVQQGGTLEQQAAAAGGGKAGGEVSNATMQAKCASASLSACAWLLGLLLEARMPCSQAGERPAKYPAAPVSCPPARQPCHATPRLPAGLQEELDLTGSREFLTKESAEEMLAPMLAPGARITKVRLAISWAKLWAKLGWLSWQGWAGQGWLAARNPKRQKR